MNRVRKAFTLVEILIVVIILGILAAIVVPQFTSASEEAQLSNAQSQLQTIRNMIELYRVRNNGQYPPSLATGTWDDLIGADYLRSAPVNPRTGEDSVVAGAVCAAGDVNGWFWSAADANGARTLRCARLDELNEFGTDTTAGATTTQWMD